MGYALLFFGILFAVTFMIGAYLDDKKEEREKLEQAKATVLKTKFVDKTTKVYYTKGSNAAEAAARGIIGDYIAGDLGFMVGIATTKPNMIAHEEHYTIFMVYYNDGTHKIDKVENDTDIYKFYLEKLDMD